MEKENKRDLDCGNPIGLRLALKKRKFGLCEDDTGTFDYILFGSYDGISISVIQSISELVPSIQADEDAADVSSAIGNGETGNYRFDKEKFSNTFLLKLLFPNAERKKQIKMDYDFWGSPSIEPERPFLLIYMLNISSACAEAYSNSAELFQFLTQTLEMRLQNYPRPQDVHLAIFPTLGYYDVVALARCASFDEINQIVNKLRGITIPNSDQKAFFSTGYTMIGVSKQLPETIDANGLEKIIIDFQLNMGVSPPATDLQQAVMSYGGKDAALILEGTSLDQLLRRYLSGQSLNPGDLQYNQRVRQKQTSFFCSRDWEENGEIRHALPAEADRRFDEWSRIFCAYRRLREQAKRTQRLTTALRQTVLTFLDLAADEHNFDIRELISPVFDALFCCMEQTNKELECANRLTDVEGLRRKVKLWDDYDRMLHAFREIVGGYINDIILSEKHFLDDSRLKHSSIGSATKLVFVYHDIMRKLFGQYGCVLVTSGGQDIIQVMNITHSPRKDEEMPQLYVIELPEFVLYNIPVALFAILHEGFHLQMLKRNTQTDCDDLQKTFIAEYSAWFVLEALWPDSSDFPPKGQFSYMDFGEIKKNFDPRVVAVRQDLYNRIKALIIDKIRNSSEESIEDLFLTCFCACNGSELTAFEDTICTFLDSMEMAYKELAKCIQSYTGDSMPNFADIYALNWGLRISRLRNQFAKLTDDKTLYIDVPLATYANIYDAFQQLAGIQNSHIGIPGWINVLQSVISECYADIGAIKALEISLPEYLLILCFLKDGEFPETIPMNVETILRIGCVLKMHYGFSADENSIADLISKVDQACGFPAEHGRKPEVKAFVEHIISLFTLYKTHYVHNGVARYLEAKLEQLLKNNEPISNQDVCSLFRSVCKQPELFPTEFFFDRWLNICSPKGEEENSE